MKFLSSQTKALLFTLAFSPCIYPMTSFATPNDPRNYMKCIGKVKDPESTIYYGGSFSEDCSTVEMAPVRAPSIELVDVRTSNHELCEELNAEMNLHGAYVEQSVEAMNKSLDAISRMTANASAKELAAARDAYAAQQLILENIQKKIEALKKHWEDVSGVPVMRVLFNFRSTMKQGNDTLAKLNPNLNVTPAKIWDVQFLHPYTEPDLKSQPAILGLNAPNDITPETFEKGVPVELLLSRSGACMYYDSKTKTFNTGHEIEALKRNLAYVITFEAQQDGETRKLQTLFK